MLPSGSGPRRYKTLEKRIALVYQEDILCLIAGKRVVLRKDSILHYCIDHSSHDGCHYIEQRK